MGSDAEAPGGTPSSIRPGFWNRKRFAIVAGALSVAFALVGVLLYPRAPAEPDPVQKLIAKWKAEGETGAGRFPHLVEALAQPENRPHLRGALRSEPDDFYLAAVVEAVRKLVDREAVPDLIARFRSFRGSRSGYFAGQNIAALLADWKVESAADALLENSDFYFPHGRNAPPLTRMGALKKVIAVAGSEEDPRRDRAVRLVAAARDPADRDALLEALRKGRAPLRQAAAVALGHYREDAVVEAALTESADDPAVVGTAVAALLRLDRARHKLRVLPLLWSDRETDTILGCGLAGEYRIHETRGTLVRLVDDAREPVKLAAIRAIAVLGLARASVERRAEGWVVVVTGEKAGTYAFRDPAVVVDFERNRP